MTKASWVSAIVGGVWAFRSVFLMLKGWSLIGDALSHSIVPGVAGADMLGLPFALGAFLAGGLAAGTMLLLNQRSGLKEGAIICLLFTAFDTPGVLNRDERFTAYTTSWQDQVAECVPVVGDFVCQRAACCGLIFGERDPNTGCEVERCELRACAAWRQNIARSQTLDDVRFD